MGIFSSIADRARNPRRVVGRQVSGSIHAQPDSDNPFRQAEVAKRITSFRDAASNPYVHGLPSAHKPATVDRGVDNSHPEGRTGMFDNSRIKSYMDDHQPGDTYTINTGSATHISTGIVAGSKGWITDSGGPGNKLVNLPYDQALRIKRNPRTK